MSSTQVSRRNLGMLGFGAVAAAAVADAAGARAPMPAGAAGLTGGNWMEQVQAQHRAIDAGFQRTKAARGPRKTAEFKALAGLLAAHSIAEETSLYPGIDMKVGDPQFEKASHDQQIAKVMVAKIDNAMAMGDMRTANATLLELEAAIKAHVAEEEGQYYPALLRAADARMNAKMTDDFRMTFTKAIA